jgi:hypothetical protein
VGSAALRTPQTRHRHRDNGRTTPMSKRFHIGDVLSITSGRLMSPRHVDGIYDICSYMTGESVFTHQLPRVASEIEHDLRHQHPKLSAVSIPDKLGDLQAVLNFLAGLYPEFGEYVDVNPLSDAKDHTSIDPIAEIKMINPQATIVEFPVSEDE